jgi:hypothetical protein
LRDLLLPPDDYHVVVDGEPAPDPYALIVDRTSAPRLDHEPEPNDVPVLASVWHADVVMQGWIEGQDTDHYLLRTTGEPQRWRLEATGEGIVGFGQLRMTGAWLALAAATPEGPRVFPDVYLGPGDHLLRVDGNGTGPYTLTATPLGPPDPDEELEPNDVDPEPLPVGTTRYGRSPIGDEDQFRFSLSAPERIRIRMEPPPDASAYVVLDGSAQFIDSAQGTGPGEPTEIAQVLQPDDYVIRVAASSPSDGRYRLEVVRDDPFADDATTELPASLVVSTDGPEVAAFWPRGQLIPATLTVGNAGAAPLDLTLDARTSDLRWSVDLGPGALTVAAGATQVVPFAIEVPVDASRVPVRVTVRARDALGAQRTAFVDVTPSRDAPPVGERLAWSVPDALLGGIDLAANGLGAVPIVSVQEAGELALHDGVSPTGGGFDTLVTLPVTLTVDLAGDTALPVAGMVLDPIAGQGGIMGTPRDVELLLSEDGTTWHSALTAELSPAPFEQSFVLATPVTARFARLSVTSTWGQQGSMRLGEWKVVAASGVMPLSDPIDLADPAVGGHVAWMDPQPTSQQFFGDVLHGDPARPPNWLVFERGTARRVTWVVAFRDGRAARVRSLGWEDPHATDPAMRLRAVDVAISEVGPDGPWESLGRWRLRRTRDGSVPPFALEDDPWVRAIRFRGDIPTGDRISVELPTRLHAFERPPDDTYRSVLGEWGDGRSDGPREWSGGSAPAAPPPVDPGNHSAAAATPLHPDEVAQGRVQRDVTEDWYTVTVPEGHRTIRFQLGGTPFVGAAAELQAPDGTSVPLVAQPSATGRRSELAASVEPGATYLVRVHQPELSAVIAFDTSASVDTSPVVQALDAFARDLVEGEEWIQLLPFGSEPLLEAWSDDRWEVADGLRRLVPAGSSAVEPALIGGAELLETRTGVRAILILTDAETESFRLQTEAWSALRGAGPVVFPAHVQGASSPVIDRNLMQDLAAGFGGGWYAYAPARSGLDVAFDRMATWLRRPATYDLVWSGSPDELAPSEPGSLSVIARAGADGSPGAAIDPDTAIEIILDTSGSMRAKLGRTTRITAAKDVLTRLVREDLPRGVPVALRWFRQEPRSCDTELAVPLGPLDPEAMATVIDDVRIVRSVQTPLAAAIDAVADDLAGITGRRLVVIVSDGRESCDGDPEAAVERLRSQGVDVTVNVVGLGLATADRARIRRIARLGGGTYFDADGAGELDDALRTAVSAPFEVYDEAGGFVGRGSVNGPAVGLPPGLYRVVVLTDPQRVFEDVLVEPGGSPTLELVAR